MAATTTTTLILTSSDTLHNQGLWPKKNDPAGSLTAVDTSPFNFCPLELVDLALYHLHHEGLRPVEWRSLLYTRMDVPLVSRVGITFIDNFIPYLQLNASSGNRISHGFYPTTISRKRLRFSFVCVSPALLIPN